MIKAVIFDLDGTLLDTLEDLKNSLNHTLRQYAMPERTLTDTRRFVGNGLKKLMERAVPEGTLEEQTEEMFHAMKAYYDLHCLEKTKPYPGTVELLEALKKKGYLLAIVSNKPDSAVKELNAHFFKEYVTVAIGECQGVAKKPAPDTVKKALKELGVRSEEAIYIGDSEVDVETAKNSLMPCISCLWGFRDEEFLIEHGASVFVKTPMEVQTLLEELTDSMK